VKKIGILFLLVVSIGYFLMRNHQDKSVQTTTASKARAIANNQRSLQNEIAVEQKEIDSKSDIVEEKDLQVPTTPSVSVIQNGPNKKLNESNLLTYEIDDGFAVINGDIIIGEAPPDQKLKSSSGSVSEPTLKVWPTNEIPIYIQPNLQNPERVNEALAYFSGTNIHFIPYENQEDVIVFENGKGACKSYLGYIGGKQPIYLSEACSAQAIAHEIMHTLGFIHEQNRTDRDDYVDIVWANIDRKSIFNFEKFSSSMMQVSGLTKFDFESIMIYPETMFSINGQATIRSKIEGQVVAPRQGLSSKDTERINRVY
jgi:Astacin (Peptidase family M12A)